MREVSSSEAARGFADLLDIVERRRETVVVTRDGRPVALIAPLPVARGRAVKDVLAGHRPDRTWSSDLHTLRDLLGTR